MTADRRHPQASGAAPEGSYRLPSFEHAQVYDAMRTGVIRCRPEADLRTIAQIMAGNEVHSVVVTAGGDAPVGIVSERELLRAAGPRAESATAGSLAVDPVTVFADDKLSLAAERMADSGVSHLIVVSAAGHPLGVLSALDVAGVLAWGLG